MRRTRLQFGLAGFLVAITVLCIWLGILARNARNQRAVLEIVRQHGGSVVLQHQQDNEVVVVAAGSPITPANAPMARRNIKMVFQGGVLTIVVDQDVKQPNFDAAPPGPAWLRSVVGDDFFQTVYSLSMQSCSDEDLERMASLGHIRRVELGGVLISNQGLSHLGKMNSLESLTLTALHVDDEGIAHLHSLKNLKQATLNINATPEAIEDLKRALPQCNVKAPARHSFSAGK